MNPGAVRTKRADARRIDRNRKKIVERDTGVVQKRGADRFGMTDNDDRTISRVVPELFEVSHHSKLELVHALAIRRPAAAADVVPALPGRIIGEVVEGASGPVAKIDFVDGGNDLDGQMEMRGENGSRLLRPSLGTGLDGNRRGFDMSGTERHLLTPQPIEFDAAQAAAQHAVEQGMVAVASQMNRLHHG